MHKKCRVPRQTAWGRRGTVAGQHRDTRGTARGIAKKRAGDSPLLFFENPRKNRFCKIRLPLHHLLSVFRVREESQFDENSGATSPKNSQGPVAIVRILFYPIGSSYRVFPPWKPRCAPPWVASSLRRSRLLRRWRIHSPPRWREYL
jgi:hypothetical protein